jgi:hypothetical protein
MGALKSKLGYFWSEGDEPTPARLVFMNACGSSTINPLSAASFVSVFLGNGSAGFIGAETRIPDAFATEYAKVFYNRVVGGASIGEALRDAKWELLARYMNPLGVLYTLHGNPDLRL